MTLPESVELLKNSVENQALILEGLKSVSSNAAMISFAIVFIASASSWVLAFLAHLFQTSRDRAGHERSIGMNNIQDLIVKLDETYLLLIEVYQALSVYWGDEARAATRLGSLLNQKKAASRSRILSTGRQIPI